MSKWRKRARRYKMSWYYYIELLKTSEANGQVLRKQVNELETENALCRDAAKKFFREMAESKEETC